MPAEAFSTDIRPAEACHMPSHIPKQHVIPMKRSPISHVRLAIPEVLPSTADEAAGNIGGKGRTH